MQFDEDSRLDAICQNLRSLNNRLTNQNQRLQRLSQRVEELAEDVAKIRISKCVEKVTEF